ncbi:MAG: non-canonical purine NTP pyrophosphatase [Flavobacteriales bacterium]|nr:non-canonical purine NTP pyrophosphatase [Flavobacteriales bacterium]|tara:strand:+ start:19101 stop:19673 length:573 start_codon:yes stop_codon:yes gene_type:complete
MKLVFATNNPNKLSEIKVLVPEGIEILSLHDIDCNEELPETTLTLEGNACQKAMYVFDNYGYNCFADDTGLEIDVLKGEPGVYSARYAGKECKAEDNINLVLKKLDGEANRIAKFRTVIALIIDGSETLFEGECKGEITLGKAGKEGFGYDPIFLPNGFDKTFAEMKQNEKGAISHRGKAVEKLVEFLHR